MRSSIVGALVGCDEGVEVGDLVGCPVGILVGESTHSDAAMRLSGVLPTGQKRQSEAEEEPVDAP